MVDLFLFGRKFKRWAFNLDRLKEYNKLDNCLNTMTLLLYQIFKEAGIEFALPAEFVVQHFTKPSNMTIFIKSSDFFESNRRMNNFFRIFVIWMGVLGVLAFSFPVYAIDYTTKGAPSSKAEKKKGSESKDYRDDEENVCTAADMQYVRKYDKRYRKRIKDYDKAYEKHGLNSPTSDEELDDMKRIAERYSKFVQSDEYKKLKALYKKCDVEHPVPKMFKPFWRYD